MAKYLKSFKTIMFKIENSCLFRYFRQFLTWSLPCVILMVYFVANSSKGVMSNVLGESMNYDPVQPIVSWYVLDSVGIHSKINDVRKLYIKISCLRRIQKWAYVCILLQMTFSFITVLCTLGIWTRSWHSEGCQMFVHRVDFQVFWPTTSNKIPGWRSSTSVVFCVW